MIAHGSVSPSIYVQGVDETGTQILNRAWRDLRGGLIANMMACSVFQELITTLGRYTHREFLSPNQCRSGGRLVR